MLKRVERRDEIGHFVGLGRERTALLHSRCSRPFSRSIEQMLLEIQPDHFRGAGESHLHGLRALSAAEIEHRFVPDFIQEAIAQQRLDFALGRESRSVHDRGFAWRNDLQKAVLRPSPRIEAWPVRLWNWHVSSPMIHYGSSHAGPSDWTVPASSRRRSE